MTVLGEPFHERRQGVAPVLGRSLAHSFKPSAGHPAAPFGSDLEAAEPKWTCMVSHGPESREGLAQAQCRRRALQLGRHAATGPWSRCIQPE